MISQSSIKKFDKENLEIDLLWIFIFKNETPLLTTSSTLTQS